MLTDEMKGLITNFSAGFVATVNDDGTPAVSPKATFVIVDDRRLAFGNLRSPHTIANLQRRPQLEVCFLDVLARRAVRVGGRATLCRREEAEAGLVSVFEAAWGDYLPRMRGFVLIAIKRAEMILSPAYDIGVTEAELCSRNLKKLNFL